MSDRDILTWEQRFLLGKCSLFDALSQYMLEGVPVPPRLVEAFMAAHIRYQSHDGKIGGAGEGQRIDDFAEPLGFKMSQREKREVARRVEVLHIRRLVDSIHEDTGKRMANPSAFENTAFHDAAEKLHKSASHIHDIYYRGTE